MFQQQFVYIEIPFMPENPKLAHAYVPFQYPLRVYAPMKGLERGTIFPCLDMPYGPEVN